MLQEETSAMHTVCMHARNRTDISAVKEIECFQEDYIVLLTEAGEITLEGEKLKIEVFSVETGKATILGKIKGLFYSDTDAGKDGFFTRRRKN